MKCPFLGSNGKQCLPLLRLLGLSIELFNRHCVNIVYYTQDWRSILKLFNSIMSGARHREEGLLRGRTAIYQFHQRLFRLVAISTLRLAGLDAHCPDTTRRTGGRNHQSVGRNNRWVIIWFFLTFLGVMIGSMANHYERATDETNDSPYSNTYEDAPGIPGEYYDPNEQQ